MPYHDTFPRHMKQIGSEEVTQHDEVDLILRSYRMGGISQTRAIQALARAVPYLAADAPEVILRVLADLDAPGADQPQPVDELRLMRQRRLARQGPSVGLGDRSSLGRQTPAAS